MFLSLTRYSANPGEDRRVTISASSIQQVQPGLGGATVIITEAGKLAVRESYESITAKLTGVRS